MGSTQAALVVLAGESTPERPTGAYLPSSATKFLSWVGTDHRINLVRATTGGWGNKLILGERVLDDGGISLAVYNGKLFLAWVGTDHRLNVRSSPDGGVTWPDASKLILPYTSDRGPALVAHGSRLYLAHTGTDGYVYMSWFDDTAGGTFGHNSQVSRDIRTDNGPSLTSFSGQLLLGFTGTDGQLNVAEVSATQMVVGRTVIIPEKSDRGVSILGLGSELLIGWKGTDSGNHLNLAVLEECALARMLRGGPGPLVKNTLADFTDRGPSLVDYNGSAALLWKGQNDDEVVVNEHVREVVPDADPSSSLNCTSTGKGHRVPETIEAAAAEKNNRLYRLVNTWLLTFDPNAAPFAAFGSWEGAATVGFRRIAAGLLAQQLVESAPTTPAGVNPDLDQLKARVPNAGFSARVEEWMLHAYQHEGLGSAGEFDFHLSEAMNLLYGFGNVKHPDGSSYLTDETVRHLVYYPTMMTTTVGGRMVSERVCSPSDSASTCRSRFDICVQQGTCISRLTGTAITNLSHKDHPLGLLTVTVPESENHVLMINGSRYLMNQWIRENPRNDAALTRITNANPSSVDNDNSTLEQGLLTVISRILKNGYFEQNSRPYGAYTVKMLMTLAAHARGDKVRTAARNAVDFTAATLAFQASYGKRYAGFRRRWSRRLESSLYGGDYVPPMFGILTGSYSFDDDPKACATPCPAPNQGQICAKDNCTWFTEGDQYRGFALDAVISGYQVPPLIQDFMLRPDNGRTGFGAYAQIAPHFAYWMYAPHNPARYPAPNVMGDPDLDAQAKTDLDPNSLHAYRDTREQFFATRDFLNSSGGRFDHWPYDVHDPTGTYFAGYDKTHGEDFVAKATTLILPGANGWATIQELEATVPNMPGAQPDLLRRYEFPNRPVYKNVALGQSQAGLPPAYTPASWTTLASDVLYTGTRFKVLSAPSGSPRLVLLSLDDFPHVGLWEVIPSTLATSELLSRVRSRNASLKKTATTFQYRTAVSNELLDVTMSDLDGGKLLILDKIDGHPPAINGTSQQEVIDAPLVRVRQTDDSYRFTGIEYVAASGDGLVTISNPGLQQTLVLDNRDPQNPSRSGSALLLKLPFGSSWLPASTGTASLPRPGAISLAPNGAGAGQVQNLLDRAGSQFTPGSFGFQVVVNGSPSAQAHLKVSLSSPPTGAVQVGAAIRLTDLKAAGATKLTVNVPSDVIATLNANPTAPVTLIFSIAGAQGSSVELSRLQATPYRSTADGQGPVGQWEQLWTTTAATSSSSNATSGATSQKVCGSGFRSLESPTFNPKTFTGISKRVAVDVRIPSTLPNPAWLGGVQLLYVNRSKAVTYLGQAELTGLTRGQWWTVSFAVPDTVFEDLQVNSGGSSLRAAVNSDLAGGAECFQLDNVRFLGPLTMNAPPMADPEAPSMTVAGAVFGFEGPEAWHGIYGAPDPTFVATPVLAGKRALAVQVSGWSPIESALFSTAEVPSAGARLTFNLLAPAPVNPYWPGDVSAYLECPTANLWNQWIGIAPIPAAGSWQPITLTLPQPLAQALSTTNDCLIRIAINAPRGAGTFFLDKMELVP